MSQPNAPLAFLQIAIAARDVPITFHRLLGVAIDVSAPAPPGS